MEILFRLLFFTDSHYTGRNASSRKDSLFETSLRKTGEIIQIGKRYDVDAYIHGGDFFDSPDISDSIAGTVGELYRKFPKKVIVVPGNHDLRANNIETLEQTKLGLLGRLGIVEILNYGKKIILEKNGRKLEIVGSPSDFGINKDIERLILKEKPSDIDIAVHVVHAMILREDAKFGDYVPINAIKDKTKADVVLSGDFHLGFNTVEYKGKYFVNPGAMVRKYNFLEEIERTPQVALITVDTNLNISVDLIPLSTALPGEEVLDRSKIIEKQKYEEKILEFKKSILMRNTTYYSSDLIDTVQYLAEQERLESEIVQEILVRLDEAKRILGIIG